MKYFFSIFFYFVTTNAFAFSLEEPSFTQEEIKPLVVNGNAIAWKVFATTTEITECIKEADGFDICHITPKYSEEIKKLDKKEVTLMGFMFPLNESDQQTNFLIGPYPINCPFEYHSPPSQIVEVISKTPVKFSFDPITIKGTLEIRHNKETGTFYYLNGK
jgi:hypothetical protein